MLKIRLINVKIKSKIFTFLFFIYHYTFWLYNCLRIYNEKSLVSLGGNIGSLSPDIIVYFISGAFWHGCWQVRRYSHAIN